MTVDMVSKSPTTCPDVTATIETPRWPLKGTERAKPGPEVEPNLAPRYGLGRSDSRSAARPLLR